MTKRIFYNISLSLIASAISLMAASQTGTRIKATVDKNRILIGEHIILRLEADIPENEAIRFFAIDSIPHFEFIERQEIDTTNTSKGTVLVQQMRITSFDSGHWVIPRLELDAALSTDSIPIDVGFTSPFDPNQEYHDIKDVIDVTIEEEKETWWWYAAGAGVLLILILIWLLTRKKKPVAMAVAKPVNAFEEAMSDLNELQKKRLPAKEYYSALADIFRLYIARRKNITSLQKTTDDLVVQLKGIGLEREQFDQLAQSLRLADFVKFAKYQPEPSDDQKAFQAIKESISFIEKSVVPAPPTSGKK